jgi:hypothetical protein
MKLGQIRLFRYTMLMLRSAGSRLLPQAHFGGGREVGRNRQGDAARRGPLGAAEGRTARPELRIAGQRIRGERPAHRAIALDGGWPAGDYRSPGRGAVGAGGSSHGGCVNHAQTANQRTPCQKRILFSSFRFRLHSLLPCDTSEVRRSQCRGTSVRRHP